MFTNALKSFTSPITSSYTISPDPTCTCGPWRIHDARKKKTNQPVSVWIFDRKTLDPSSASSSTASNFSSSLRSNPSRDGLKAAQDETVDRLRKGASLLARLRHPCVLELAEPVEDTRGGGLMFATEAVVGSLAEALAEKDAGGSGTGSGRRRAEVEIDELEIQKGLLQVGKALEFLHESAALVHGNVCPEAVVVNSKSDWKLTSLTFTVPSTNPPLPPQFDSRLPPSVQIALDYASPELVLDNTLSTSADLFSLGLLILTLHNHPHKSPLTTHNSPSTYRRLLSSPSTTPSTNNNFLCPRPLPRALTDALLPHLLTRHPTSRITAREFQQNEYFDNILVSALRFLDSLPAKTPSEKAAFMRGLPKVLPQFPRSVLEKKVLPGLIEELRDGSMLALVLPNVFAIVEGGGARLFGEKVLGKLKEVFLGAGAATTTTGGVAAEPKTAAAKIAEREKESGREGGLTVVISNMRVVMEKTTSREFKEDVLPIYQLALESHTHALQDLALRSLVVVLPKLDFPTLKNDLFPVVASVFTKTSSLGIKIRGLEAFSVLCGGTPPQNDGFGGEALAQRSADSPVLDKYTIQEKVVPLLKGIKTKEAAVMMAALKVFDEIGRVCDREVVAMELLPGLWTMSFGPLLGLEQFQAFMTTIKTLSSRIEAEQTRKLQDLSSTAPSTTADTFLSFGGIPGASSTPGPSGDDAFADLVFGKHKPSSAAPSPGLNGWNTSTAAAASSNEGIGAALGPQTKTETPTFSWSTPAPSPRPQQQQQSTSTPMLTPIKAPASPGLPPPLTANNYSSSSSNTRSSSAMGMGSMGMGMGMGMSALQPQPSPGFGSTTALRPQAQAQSGMGTSSGGIDWSSAAGTKKPTLSTAPLTPRPANTSFGSTSSGNYSSSTTTTTTTGTSNYNINNTFTNNFSPPPQQQQSHPTILYGQTRQQSAPAVAQSSSFAGFMIPPPPSANGNSGGGMNLVIGSGALAGPKKTQTHAQGRGGLEGWDSLL